MNAEAEGRAAAEKFRRDHRLGVQPLGDLVAAIEQTTGIDVAVLDTGPDEHGSAMRDPVRGAIFIGVARTRHPMRQRSTLAHELAHVLFDDWSDTDACNWSDRSPSEIRADAFARHLLLPTDGLREFLGASTLVTEPILSTVVQRFLVSPPVAAIALYQADYIDDDTKRAWMALTTPKLAARFGWSDQYRSLSTDSDRRRAPQRLLARAIRGYSEGVLSARAIATLRGTTVEIAEADLREAGVVPVEQAVAWTGAADLPDVQVDLVALNKELDAPDDPESKRDAG
ncbi:ImmA/IrrE family metallo-endopeptidase [Nocardia rhamnosiphila]